MIIIPNKPSKGETQEHYMSKCVKELKGEGKSSKKAREMCSAVWYKYRGNEIDNKPIQEGDTVEFKINSEMRFITNDEGEESIEIVAAIGDRFMNGGFLSTEELKKSTKLWNGTLHDIDHKGIGSWQFGMNIGYFIGWHDKAKMEDNALIMRLNIDEHTAHYAEWKGYIDLLRKAGKIPNVSTTYTASVNFTPAKDIKTMTSKQRKAARYDENDLVPVLTNIQPYAVATVVIGRCNDKDGCGIRKNESCECGSCKIDDNTKEEIDKELEKKKLIQKIKILEEN